jgi:hypothetical protein
VQTFRSLEAFVLFPANRIRLPNARTADMCQPAPLAPVNPLYHTAHNLETMLQSAGRSSVVSNGSE